MKRRSFLIITAIFFVLTHPFIIGAQTTFEKWYGGDYKDEGSSVIQTADSCYLVAGDIRYASNYTDAYLLKLDENGDTIWTRRYGGNNYDFAYSVIQTTDGNYVLVGRTWSYGAGWFDAYLIKTNQNGDTLWTKTYGGSGKDGGGSVKQTTDGGYIFTGQYNYTDVYLVKTDGDGDLIWSKTYGGSGTDGGMDVIQTADSCYLVVGLTKSFGPNPSTGNIYVIKTKQNGDTVWTRVIGDNAEDYPRSICEAIDGGYIIAGFTQSHGAGGRDVYLVKIDANGDTVWTKTYGGTGQDVAYSIARVGVQGYIIIGQTDSYGAGNSDVWVIRTDVNGDTLWTRTYGGNQDDYASSVARTVDGGYILTGRTDSYGAGGDIYVIKDTMKVVPGTVSGTISYSGDSTGTLYISVWTDIEAEEPTVFDSIVSPSFPQAYSITDDTLTDGIIGAVWTWLKDNPEFPELGEPAGCSDAFFISGGSASGVDITLTEKWAPSTPIASGMAEHILLTWIESDAVNLVGYRIYRGSNPDNINTLLADVLPTSHYYEDHSVSTGVRYYYAVMGLVGGIGIEMYEWEQEPHSWAEALPRATGSQITLPADSLMKLVVTGVNNYPCYPALSPDNSKLLYVEDEEFDGWDLRVKNLATGVVDPFTTGGASIFELPAWTADGEMVGYIAVTGYDVYGNPVLIRTSDQQEIIRDEEILIQCISIDPSGNAGPGKTRWVVSYRDTTTVPHYNGAAVATGTPGPNFPDTVVEIFEWLDIWGISVSYDGNSIAFATNEAEEGDFNDIFVFTGILDVLNGSQPPVNSLSDPRVRRITYDAACDEIPTWSLDNNYILAFKLVRGYVPPELFHPIIQNGGNLKDILENYDVDGDLVVYRDSSIAGAISRRDTLEVYVNYGFDGSIATSLGQFGDEIGIGIMYMQTSDSVGGTKQAEKVCDQGYSCVIFPSGSVPSPMLVTINTPPNLTDERPVDAAFIGVARQFGPVGTVFSDSVVISLHYLDQQIVGSEEDSLAIYSWNGTEWTHLANSVINLDSNLVSAKVIEFANYYGVFEKGEVGIETGKSPILSFALRQSRPNPARRSIMIEYTIPQSRHTRLAIYNCAGCLVNTLSDGYCKSGAHRYIWDTRDSSGKLTPSGVYFIRLEAGTDRAIRKILLVR